MNTLCLQNMIKVAKRTWMFWPRHIVIYHSLGDEHPITSSFWVTNTSLQTTHMENLSTQKCMDDQRLWFPVWILIHPHIAGWSFQIHLWIIYVWLWFDYVCFIRSQGMFVLVMSECPGSPIFCQAPWWRSCRVSVTWRSCLTQQRELWWIKGDIMWYHVISTIYMKWMG